ncbi:hypothetical protein [Streptomyces diastatochromogenes]|uniref:Uncharacterized protein n=1 Tax=Streptomyces diastatochromogenes TaxID=42236 RepID=A0A233SCV1_STRDA|nr:hypothetical protein [Streptomyces diastatochromogenes]MCZ0990364.1 hypothetical protein [Streptomyces diastatochromogenes]OXY93452.1 hypothetical protein BEK98_22330 [Streptomyces diastatochromogenes]
MPLTAQDGLPGLEYPHQDGRPTITDQFRAFDAEHPRIYRALEQLVEERLAAGAERVGMKALFEALRWRWPEGAKGLNNSYTALYARRLLAVHPEWASVIEVRRRRSP